MTEQNLEQQLQAIWRVADKVSRQGGDDAARQAAQAVLRYFSSFAGDQSRDAAPAATASGAPSSELRAMCQTIEQLSPMIDIVRLLDALASMSAAKERRKISLDLHDSTIQPYLGLKLGLESLRRKVDPSNPLAADIDELCVMANESIAELRRYVRGLKGEPRQRPVSCLDLVRRQAERFKKFYGMEVEISADLGFELTGDLGSELVQIVGESLSNIGRHTLSRRVRISLSQRDRHLVAEIINFGSENDEGWRDFTPASIAQRAARLGGSVAVSRHQDGGATGTVVRVDIPLEAEASPRLDSKLAS